MDSLEDEPSSNGRLYAPLLIAKGSALVAAGGLNIAGRCLEICARRSTPIAELARDSMNEERDDPMTRNALRDELLSLMVEMGEAASHEIRRSVAEFDSSTHDPAGDAETEYRRASRVKK